MDFNETIPDGKYSLAVGLRMMDLGPLSFYLSFFSYDTLYFKLKL